MYEHGEDKDHGLWPQSEPSEKNLERIRGVCQTGVGRNAVFCGGCLSWIHKKCRGIKFSCAGCLGKARPIDGRLVKEVLVDDETVEAVPEFCYLRGMLSAGRGCELAAVTCAANRLRASFVNYSLSTPIAICNV